MAEEHRLQAPKLCVNNCGFFGSPATGDLCSKCHRDLQLKEQQSSSAMVAALNKSLGSAVSSSSSSSFPTVLSPPADSVPVPSAGVFQVEATQTAAPASHPNRCSTCRRRVGLTGFKCRCGLTYCGSHRYPEQHACGFDFKEMGREQISKANPVIKAPKIDKI